MKQTTSLLIAILLTSGVKAQFGYQRQARVDSSGWYTVELTEAVLTRLYTDYRDIRVFAENDTLEVPYVLKVSTDQFQREPVSSEPFNLSRQGKNLYFTIQPIDEKPVNGVRLSFEETNFDGWVTVEGSNNQKDWFELVSQKRIISLQDENIVYQSTSVDWPVSRYNFLRFTISADRELTLNPVQFSSVKRRIGSFDQFEYPIKAVTQKKQTEALIKFNSTQLISKLIIQPEEGQKFYRNFRVEGVTDSAKAETGWVYYKTTLHSGVLTSDVSDTIQFEPILCSQVSLIIENQDSPPIKLKSLTTWSPKVHLIAFLTKGKHWLRYGNKLAQPPRYDLSHFENEIPDSLPLVEIMEEEVISMDTEIRTQPWFQSKNWLWAIMFSVIALLGFFTVRMLRKA
jgi:hypothetical protein